MKGPETEKAHKRRSSPRHQTTFFDRFMRGTGLDIGFRGSLMEQAEPVLPTAIGVDRDYPGYDGKKLPFSDESQDYVYSSHCLEHINSPQPAIQEWMRVVKTGGYLVLTVPHRDLYEKKLNRPSIWNAGHRRFYTPQSLLSEIESALAPNTYRVRYLQDCDDGYDYSIGPDKHPGGEYQIECVLQKLNKPDWEIA